jgi:hypothetical protein
MFAVCEWAVFFSDESIEFDSALRRRFFAGSYNGPLRLSLTMHLSLALPDISTWNF